MITQEHKDRIRLQLNGLTAMPVDAGHVFYQTLFEKLPETRVLFDDDMDHQAEKLIDMVFLVVHFLDGMETLSDEIVDLGRRHVDYGLKPYHLDAGKGAFLTALGATLRTWELEDQEAWDAMLNELLALMAQGLAEGQAERAAQKSAGGAR